MVVKEICDKLELTVLTEGVELNKKVSGAYICDLLSWVMGHAQKGDAWITIQSHANIIAVASLLELPCIIICEDAEVDEDTIEKAIEEEIAILSSSGSAFSVAKKLIEAGLGS